MSLTLHLKAISFSSHNGYISVYHLLDSRYEDAAAGAVLEFSGVVAVHMYPEHVLGAAVSHYLSWSWVAARDGVCEAGGSDSQFTGLLLWHKGAACLL